MEEGGGLSDLLLEQLNSLGFALIGGETDGGPSFTLTRFALGYHLRLTIEAVGSDKWLIGLDTRATSAFGQLPEPSVPFALGRFGASPDGLHLELSKDELEGELPRLLGGAIIPVVDLAYGHDG